MPKRKLPKGLLEKIGPNARIETEKFSAGRTRGDMFGGWIVLLQKVDTLESGTRDAADPGSIQMMAKGTVEIMMFQDWPGRNLYLAWYGGSKEVKLAFRVLYRVNSEGNAEPEPVEANWDEGEDCWYILAPRSDGSLPEDVEPCIEVTVPGATGEVGWLSECRFGWVEITQGRWAAGSAAMAEGVTAENAGGALI